MPLRRSGFAAFCFAVVISSVGGLPAQTSPVGLPEVTPKYVKLNVATTVTVTVRIDDGGVIKNSVMLQEVDSNGKLIATLGMMRDDGIAPDLKANDNVFTITVPLTVSDKDKPRFLHVAAKLNGMKNVECGKQPVTAVDSFLPVTPTPEQIQDLLTNDPSVRSAAAFLQRLDPSANFKRDWIMITNTKSAQNASAKHPRLIVQNSGAKGDGATAVYGVDDQDLIEYIQWDGSKFRFHEIDTKGGMVNKDRQTCFSCHSGPPDQKSTWPYPRPNWDAYDNWGGALPFNRDRIYLSDTAPTVEQKSVQRVLTDLAGDPVFKQLDLPENVSRNCDGTQVNISPDPVKDGSAAELGNDANKGPLPVKFDAAADAGNQCKLPPVLFNKGGKCSLNVDQGGLYLTMHNHNGKDSGGIEDLKSDEGRGVGLFDNFSALNAKRIGQELKDKFDKEGVQFVDIRPVALAIAGGGKDGDCKVNFTTLADYIPPEALPVLLNHFGMKEFKELYQDTQKQRHSLPQLKANQQGTNAASLLDENKDAVTAEAIVKQVAQRSVYGLPSRATDFAVDSLTGFTIDREIYGPPAVAAQPDPDLQIALFRLFLEPSHEKVNKWSLSLNARSNTYTFADVFDIYLDEIRSALNNDTFGNFDGTDKKMGSAKGCAELKADSVSWFKDAVANHKDYFK